jgi:poly(hydroxyalkanoate) granule-associated protein
MITMPTKTKPAEEEEKGQEQSPFLEGARKVLLASIGAVALAQEEVESFVNFLVERGEIAEKEGRELMRELVEKRKQRREEAKGRFGWRVEKTLDRMDVPTKADIEALSDKINALSKKIDDLKKSQS